MNWKIEYYETAEKRSSVKEFINSLSPESKAKYVFVSDLLEEHGIVVKEPYVKPITGYRKLFEIRIKDKANIHRIFYFAFTGRKFILLHGFTKKTERTPIREIEIAVKRMEDFLAKEVRA